MYAGFRRILPLLWCCVAPACVARGNSQTLTVGYSFIGQDPRPALMIGLEGAFIAHTGVKPGTNQPNRPFDLNFERPAGVAATASSGLMIDGIQRVPYAAAGIDLLLGVSRRVNSGLGGQVLYNEHWGAVMRGWISAPVFHVHDATVAVGTMLRCQLAGQEHTGCGVLLMFSREQM
jgi:hypothetical protein